MFKFLIWAVVIYFILKFLSRLFLPIVLKKVVQQMQQPARPFQAPNQRPYGSVSVEDNHKNSRQNGQSFGGEYVDYEEIK